MRIFLLKTMVLCIVVVNGCAIAPDGAPEYFVDTAARVKITNRCPFSCSFCHNEGTEVPASASYRRSTMLDERIKSFPDIEDLNPSGACSVQLLAGQLKDLGITTVHLTGGEPTSASDLPVIVRTLTSNGLIVKLTSNGQLRDVRLLDDLKRAGLVGINFSILSLDPEELLKTQTYPFATHERALEWAKIAIVRLRASIMHAQELGIEVKINAVVLGEYDYKRIDVIRQFAQENHITLNLLSSLEDKITTHQAALAYAARQHARFIRKKESINTSVGGDEFVLPDGTNLRVKYFRPCQPAVVCEGCEHYGKPSCAEQFYGLRVEMRGGKPYARLCIQRSTPRTLLPLDEFAECGELRSLLTA